jgi:hypothetical protein
MKVLVAHDAQGSIKALGFSTAERTGIGIKPGNDRQVSVVEIAAIEHAGQLAVYAKDYRVDFRSGQTPKLVKR